MPPKNDKLIKARKDCIVIASLLVNAAKNTQKALYSTEFLSDPIKIFDDSPPSRSCTGKFKETVNQ